MAEQEANRLLSEQEAAFVRALLGEARGQRAQAAIMAGYKAKGAATAAARLLSRVHVQRAIRAAQFRRLKASIATNDEIDREMTRIMRTSRSERNRMRAAEILNKTRGRYSIKIQHEGTLTLEDAIARSRREKVVDGQVVPNDTAGAAVAGGGAVPAGERRLLDAPAEPGGGPAGR